MRKDDTFRHLARDRELIRAVDAKPAALEVRDDDPDTYELFEGRMWYRSDTDQISVYNGTIVKRFSSV